MFYSNLPTPSARFRVDDGRTTAGAYESLRDAGTFENFNGFVYRVSLRYSPQVKFHPFFFEPKGAIFWFSFEALHVYQGKTGFEFLRGGNVFLFSKTPEVHHWSNRYVKGSTGFFLIHFRKRDYV